jgi:DNA-binding Xre family transcriptional regulator
VPRPERNGGAHRSSARPEAATKQIIRSALSIRKSNYGRCYQPASTELRLVRFHLAAILERKGWTPYRLARETGLTVPTAYRLADPEVQFGRFTADTLDRLCAALGVQPGELLEWVPDKNRRRQPR